VAEPTRRALLDLLAEEARPMQELAAHFDISIPAVSQHLKVLREAGLVQETRDGRHRVYRLTPAPLEILANWVNPYQRFWNKRLQKLGEHLAQQKSKKAVIKEKS
jgi:DNA-binding transcriptional ArsR family regulator